MTEAPGGAVAAAPPPPVRMPYDRQDAIVLGSAAVAAAMVAAVAAAGIPQLQPLVGLIAILAIAYALSTNRRAIDGAHGRLGPGAAGRLRAARAQDLGRPGAVPAAWRGDQPGARLHGRGILARVRPAGRQGGLVANHDRRARGRRGALQPHLRPPGAADDHLHRRALRHPVLLRRHADRRPAVRAA